MATIEANVDELEEQLKQWGVKLDELAAQAEDACSDAKAGDDCSEAKAEYHQRVVALMATHEAAQKKVAEFRAADCGKWDNFKADIEKLWQDLESAFDKLTN